MDSRPSAVEPNQTYQSPASWSHANITSSPHGQATPRTPGDSTPTSNGFSDSVATGSYPPTLDLLPLLFSQHQAQLLQYNKLVSPGRGGGGGLQSTTCLPVLASVPSIQAAPRSRSRSSSSKVSNKDGQSYKQSPAAQSCHGIRSTKNTERQDCEAMTMGKDSDTPTPGKDKSSPIKNKETPTKTKETPTKMPLKPQPDLAHPLPSRPANRVAQQSNGSSAQSSSVPNTPQQRARNFSFESRDPSPNATQNHSPRSAYSEPNGGAVAQAVRSKASPCPFETASANFRRRMPYSLGSERLEKVDLDKVKSKLTEDEERKLCKDMQEVYARLLPSPEVEQNREKLVQKLEKMFNDEWPGHDIQVHVFGSSGNLLCSDNSDVDMCITTDWKPMEGVCIIADLLHRRGLEKVVCISKAKVPIVKVWDPELKLACDINVNNTQALENTRMVRTYIEIDERVRPLAMIIKYWTRRRVVNDAAFGYTLSSYTWICMIVAFLQLRDPPVLPALHQCPEKSLSQPSEFADDLSQLRGFGKKNKSSIGALLFQFFRFYAHEFDYEKMVLSIRLGRTILKEATKWERTANKDLCVEEPFNRERNLGNTLDEFSFRGLHLELRRAFDLLAEAKLDECCEQFHFPKEEPSEPKVFVKPTSRPAIIRSSSQQHAGRGGRNGGGRGNKFRNGNSNRRASSSNAYEQAQANAPHGFGTAMPHPAIYQTVSPNGELQWATAAPYPFPTSEMALSHALLSQQERLNWLFQAHQAHILSQHAHAAQRLHTGSSQQAERSRTNSFDQAPPPPLTALPRDYGAFQYPPHHQAMLYSTWQSGYGTYPSSPSTSTAPPSEFRRSLHRSSAAHEHGNSSSDGTLRSQSQPASRSSTATVVPGPGYAAASQALGGSRNLSSRNPQLSPFPSFASDDRTDSDADESSNRTLPDSPPDEDSAGYLGYFVADSTIPPLNPNVNVPILNDIALSGSRSHRLSTEGPQSVLDRRLLRTSRSPSPHEHARAVSTGADSAPLPSAPFTRSAAREGSPLVVNGSLIPTPHGSSNWHASQVTDDAAYDNPLHISQGSAAALADSKPTGPERPLVVNGSTTPSPMLASTIAALPSFGQRIAPSTNTSNTTYANAFGDAAQGKLKTSDLLKWQRAPPRSYQAAGIAPLDLAIANPMYAEAQNLSPVYEHRTPSPTVLRDRGLQQGDGAVSSEGARQESALRSFQKSSDRNGPSKESIMAPNISSRVNGQGPTSNGPIRGSRPEPDNGGWQKPKGRKKPTGDSRVSNKGSSQSEQPPKNGMERKGG